MRQTFDVADLVAGQGQQVVAAVRRTAGQGQHGAVGLAAELAAVFGRRVDKPAAPGAIQIDQDGAVAGLPQGQPGQIGQGVGNRRQRHRRAFRMGQCPGGHGGLEDGGQIGLAEWHRRRWGSVIEGRAGQQGAACQHTRPLVENPASWDKAQHRFQIGGDLGVVLDDLAEFGAVLVDFETLDVEGDQRRGLAVLANGGQGGAIAHRRDRHGRGDAAVIDHIRVVFRAIGAIKDDIVAPAIGQHIPIGLQPADEEIIALAAGKSLNARQFAVGDDGLQQAGAVSGELQQAGVIDADQIAVGAERQHPGIRRSPGGGGAAVLCDHGHRAQMGETDQLGLQCSRRHVTGHQASHLVPDQQ